MSRAVGSVLPGINAFCAPIFDHEGKMVVAITALGPASLFPSSWSGPHSPRHRLGRTDRYPSAWAGPGSAPEFARVPDWLPGERDFDEGQPTSQIGAGYYFRRFIFSEVVHGSGIGTEGTGSDGITTVCTMRNQIVFHVRAVRLCHPLHFPVPNTRSRRTRRTRRNGARGKEKSRSALRRHGQQQGRETVPRRSRGQVGLPGDNFDKLDADKDGGLSWEEFLGHNRWPDNLSARRRHSSARWMRVSASLANSISCWSPRICIIPEGAANSSEILPGASSRTTALHGSRLATSAFAV
jgi:hypothetical protein